MVIQDSVSVGEAPKIAKVSRSTVLRAIASGDLPAEEVKAGERSYFAIQRSDVTAYTQSRRSQSEPPKAVA